MSTPEVEALVEKIYHNQDYAVVFAPELFKKHHSSPAFLSAYVFACLQMGQVVKAEKQLRTLVQRKRTSAQVFYLLGECQELQGKVADALTSFLHALNCHPREESLLQSLSAAFVRLNHFGEALKTYMKYLSLIEPKLQDRLVLGTLLENTHQYQKAEELYHALVLTEGEFDLHTYQRLAYVLRLQGKSEQSELILSQALALCQKSLKQEDFHTKASYHWAQVHSEWIQTLYLKGASSSEMMQALFQWQQTHETPYAQVQHQVESGGKLKIGYISADFRQSSLAILAYSLISNHSSQFEIFLYHSSNASDPITQLFQSLPVQWRACGGLTPRQIASTIRGDQVQVLVDLSGHTSASSLALMAHQLAPVQVSGLGFNAPTGLRNIQYRFTDRVNTPVTSPGSETPLYLDSWIYCLPPQEEINLYTPQNPSFIYYSPHHPGKLNPQVIQAWARILKQHPNSQLHLRHKAFEDEGVQVYFEQAFLAQDVPADRLHFFAAIPYLEYLKSYNQVDLVLDPFPCHGGMVSCDSLMMGVPFVTLNGDMKGGVSLLKQVELDFLVADTIDEYVQVASQFRRQDLDLRQTLSYQFLTSPVCDSKGFADQVERQFKVIWNNYQNALS